MAVVGSRRPGPEGRQTALQLGRGLAGLLLVVAIASWTVSAPILVRLLLLLLALFALGGPTFAGGETRTRLRYVGVWAGAVVVTVYLMLLATGVSIVQTSNETVYGGFFLTWILAIAGIVGAVLLRYLYEQHRERQRELAESSARLQALQARVSRGLLRSV